MAATARGREAQRVSLEEGEQLGLADRLVGAGEREAIALAREAIPRAVRAIAMEEEKRRALARRDLLLEPRGDERPAAFLEQRLEPRRLQERLAHHRREQAARATAGEGRRRPSPSAAKSVRSTSANARPMGTPGR